MSCVTESVVVGNIASIGQLRKGCRWEELCSSYLEGRSDS